VSVVAGGRKSEAGLPAVARGSEAAGA
jgi:hypothetical protein